MSLLLTLYFFFLMIRPPPTSTLFPYTTLFRSVFAFASVAFASVFTFVSTAGLVAAFASTLGRSEEHTSELQSPCNLVCRLLLEKKKITREIHKHPLYINRLTGETCNKVRSCVEWIAMTILIVDYTAKILDISDLLSSNRCTKCI